MLLYPHAKINLGLRILERLDNGFHRIESVFYPIGLCDILEVNHARADSFIITGLIPANSQPAENLVIKALKLFREQSGATNCFQLHLHKCIPAGAGLGGGSSDAASALKAFNVLCNNILNQADLELLASQLGSDVPFFFKSQAAYLLGTGKELEDYALDLGAYWLLVLKPEVSVSTAWAYNNCSPRAGVELADLLQQAPERWQERIANDFEEVVFAAHPEIAECKKRIERMKPVFSSLSGSGSAVFGLFNHEPNVDAVPDSFFKWKEKLK